MAKQREKRLTKRERKAQGPGATTHDHNQHIHCVACGKHLDPQEFQGAGAKATVVQCAHGSGFASCVSCTTVTKMLLDEHDRTGQPVRTAAAWH